MSYIGKGGTNDMRDRLATGEVKVDLAIARLAVVETEISNLDDTPNSDPGDLTLLFDNRII